MKGQEQATNRVVPLQSTGLPDGSGINVPFQFTLTASPAGAQPIPSITSADPRSGQLIWITLAPTVNMRIRFGVVGTLGNAVQTDRLIFGGQETDYEVPPGITHFSFVKATGEIDGELSGHISSL